MPGYLRLLFCKLKQRGLLVMLIQIDWNLILRKTGSFSLSPSLIFLYPSLFQYRRWIHKLGKLSTTESRPGLSSCSVLKSFLPVLSDLAAVSSQVLAFSFLAGPLPCWSWLQTPEEGSGSPVDRVLVIAWWTRASGWSTVNIRLFSSLTDENNQKKGPNRIPWTPTIKRWFEGKKSPIFMQIIQMGSNACSYSQINLFVISRSGLYLSSRAMTHDIYSIWTQIVISDLLESWLGQMFLQTWLSPFG